MGTLYLPFEEKWNRDGSIYLISDTHFSDADCKLMAPDWISPKEYIQKLRKTISKNDTLIHLGDVGDVKTFDLWPKYKRPYMVLLMGNYDKKSQGLKDYFDEIYEGPLMIGEKLLLSHEPVYGLSWVFNIHGHIHDIRHQDDEYHCCITSNIIGYRPIRLKEIIHSGVLKQIDSLHRQTIDSRNIQKEGEKDDLVYQ